MKYFTSYWMKQHFSTVKKKNSNIQKLEWEETRGGASGQQEESSEEELPSSKCFGLYFLTLYRGGATEDPPSPLAGKVWGVNFVDHT